MLTADMLAVPEAMKKKVAKVVYVFSDCSSWIIMSAFVFLVVFQYLRCQTGPGKWLREKLPESFDRMCIAMYQVSIYLYATDMMSTQAIVLPQLQFLLNILRSEAIQREQEVFMASTAPPSSVLRDMAANQAAISADVVHTAAVLS